MAVREVLRYPDPALKQRSRAVERGERTLIARVARDLVDTMRAHERCVGVAAPQLGELVRMVAVDVTGETRRRSGAKVPRTLDAISGSTQILFRSIVREKLRSAAPDILITPPSCPHREIAAVGHCLQI